MQKRLNSSSVTLLKEVFHISRMIEQKRLTRYSLALLKIRVSYLKNDLDLGLWMMQKRLSRSSVALLKRSISYLKND